jgi:hypothetical protein
MDEIKILLAKIDTALHRNMWLIISIIAFCFVACLAIIFFYNPPSRFNRSEVQAKEKDRQLLEKQNDAFRSLVKEQEKNIAFFTQRDSMLRQEINLNTKAIEKIKIPNEKITRIQHFSSAELQSYFANLPDPGQ